MGEGKVSESLSQGIPSPRGTSHMMVEYRIEFIQGMRRVVEAEKGREIDIEIER